MRKFLVALWAMLCVASSSFSQDFVRPGLEKVEAMTSKFLASPDAAQLSFDGPKWAQAVESFLCMASDSAVAAFSPSCMTRFDLRGGDVAWAALWNNGGKGRLVWFAVSKICEPEGGFADDALRRASAYVDDIDCADTLLTLSPLTRDGLAGIAVAKPDADSDDEPIFAVPDVRSRLALRIITDINFSDAEKADAEALFRKRLDKATATLDADLAGLPELTFCDSPDEKIRTITYMVNHFDFTSSCGGWIVIRPKRGTPSVFPLTDASDKVGKPEQAILTHKKWYGAIYSDIIQFEYNDDEYYAIVGYKGATPTVKTRVIDVLKIRSDGKPVFGAKVFRHPKASYYRRIFQYSAKSSMTIHYDENSQIIVMDHLEPSQRIMVGHPEFYGPDLSYDAYVLADNGWEFQSDIQVTEEEGAVANEEDGPTAADDYEYPTDRRTVSVGSQQTQTSHSRNSSSRSSSKSKSSSKPSSNTASTRSSDSDAESESSEVSSSSTEKSSSKSSSKSTSKSSSKSSSRSSSKSSSKSSNKSSRSSAKSSSSSSSSWSGRSSRSSRRNKSSISSWLDKGKGNSAPNIRNRR